MTFSIHNVKTVLELNAEWQVNQYLQDGWVLLSVGFETGLDETQKVYVLGNILDREALDKNNDDGFDEFCESI